MSARPRQFRPAPPALRDRLKIIFFGLLTIAGIAGWIRERTLAPLSAGLFLTAVASWFYYRRRVIGSPRLDVDREGLRFRSGKRDVRAAWADISAIRTDFYRDEIQFVRSDGEPPVIVSIDMTTGAGERFDNLMEEYWTPPEARR